MTDSIIETILSYGALGACTAYFAIKDWQLNSKLQDTLNEFTIVMKTMLERRNDV